MGESSSSMPLHCMYVGCGHTICRDRHTGNPDAAMHAMTTLDVPVREALVKDYRNLLV